MKPIIHTKRIYDPAEKDDGQRILVDRLWPRGVTKERAALDLWLKEIAPSTELRQWFAHDPAKWEGFRKKYRQELAQEPEAVAVLKERIKKGPVTLLFGARDESHNEALVLKDFLLGH